MRHLATIGLGANLPSPVGSPAETLAAAVRELSLVGSVAARSSLYSSEPVGLETQSAFINAAVQIQTELDPEPLLSHLLRIERRYGRDRTRDIPKGPRSLDLDLLIMDDLVLHTPELTIPHPALHQRRFVLVPLCEIAPEMRHPILKSTMAELLAALPDEGPNRAEAVRRVGSLQEPA